MAQLVESGEKVAVGVNRFATEGDEPAEVAQLDPELTRQQLDRLRKVRAERDQAAVDAALKSLEEAARSDENLLYPMREALAAYATLGEVSDVLRGVFGRYEPRGNV
jgi:methylmalonyl-CoA mutase N-terminal domain/subunit